VAESGDEFGASVAGGGGGAKLSADVEVAI